MTYYLGLILAGAFGAIFGSYSTLFAYRIPLGESCFGRYFGPKSRCPKCDTIIRTRDLIPLLNWLFTLGKCTSCNTKIPRSHLFIEVSCTILFILCYIKFSFSEEFLIYAMLSSALVVLTVIDYQYKNFPDKVLNVILILGLVGRVLEDQGITYAIFSVAIGIVSATIFYQIFHKKFAGFLIGQNQSLSYAKFIIIVSVCLSPLIFLLYFLSIFLILALLLILDGSIKNKNFGIGFALILPFVWLMLHSSF